MSESESIKADIAFHEKMFFAAIALIITLIGWLASSYGSSNDTLAVLALIACFLSACFTVYQYRLVKRLIKELKYV